MPNDPDEELSADRSQGKETKARVDRRGVCPLRGVGARREVNRLERLVQGGMELGLWLGEEPAGLVQRAAREPDAPY